MGRLTLNVLLSFAQFEREVTGERIRDKISASKDSNPLYAATQTPSDVWSAMEWLADRQDSNGMICTSA